MLYDELKKYSKTDMYPMHMPGHKRNKDIVNMIDPYSIDITEIDGFDDMHHQRGLIKHITDKANSIYKAYKTFLSVNGSSIGLLSAISATTNMYDKILIARNSHKSVYNAVYIRNLQPIYIYPSILDNNINGGIRLEDIQEAIRKNKDIKAVVITSPTYEGIVSDIKSISEYLHKKNIPLIVDSAHGAHLGIFENGSNAILDNADIVVTSIHKTLPAFTQTALVCVNKTNLVDVEKLEKYMSIYQTSSPSYILMSGIDKCLQIIEDKGIKLYKELQKNLDIFYKKTNNLKNIKIMQYLGMDKTKIVILGNGYKIYDTLREKYHIQLEMKCLNYALAMTSICDSKEGIERLMYALLEMDNNKDFGLANINKNLDKVKPYKAEVILSPYKIDKYEQEILDINMSQDKISASFVYLYPPDIPLIVPGEKISKEQIDFIKTYKDAGFRIEGIKDFKIIKN